MSSAEIRADLRAVLTSRLGDGSSQIDTNLALLDDPVLVARIPDLTLRAALVSLSGTWAEPVINSYRNDPAFTTATFTTPPDGNVAQSWVDPVTHANSVWINPRYRFENYLEFGPELIHERLHQDTLDSYEEELAAKALESLGRMDALDSRPQLATAGTELSVLKNDWELGRLNSAVGDRMRIYSSQGPVFPGSECDGCASLASFSELYSADVVGNPTAGNNLLDQLLTNLAEPGHTWVTGGNFGDALTFLDANHAGFTAAQQVRIARTLKLKI